MGQSPSEFWGLTYRVISAVIAGCAEKRRYDHNELAWAAWHIEALSRRKKMPKLTEFTTPKAERRPQSVSEQISIARRWTAAIAASRR